MNSSKIVVIENGNTLCEHTFSDSIEIGRQRQNEPPPPSLVEGDAMPRLIIATLTELEISRKHLLITRHDANSIDITNLINRGSITLNFPSGRLQFEPSQTRKVTLPCEFQIGNNSIRILAADSDRTPQPEPTITGLPHQTLPPLSAISGDVAMSIADFQHAPALPAEKIIAWMNQVLGLFQDVAGTAKFFQKALGGMLQMLNLTSAAVLFFEAGNWRVDTLCASDSTASDSAASDSDDRQVWRPSQTILEQMRRERRSLRQLPAENQDTTNSLATVNSLVAAPILSAEGQVIGALYGDRRNTGFDKHDVISELETLFVELIASGVANGLARLEQEKKAAAAQTRFEQFFPPSLAKKLQEDDELLAGKICNVSVLFCDIRQFSRISQRIGPAETINLINGVMDVLSQCVLANQGVLVDYIGDELMAMWGAPDDQPDHALLACRAAVEMLRTIPALNASWSERIGAEVAIGIGINSGPAQVGNIGSNVKFKYGPLGDAVNVASRIESATKLLQTSAMITQETFDATNQSVLVRRLCTVRVVNVDQPKTLYELPVDHSSLWLNLRSDYESSLQSFENRDFDIACRQLTELNARFPHDRPTAILLARAIAAANQAAGQAEIIWNLEQK